MRQKNMYNLQFVEAASELEDLFLLEKKCH